MKKKGMIVFSVCVLLLVLALGYGVHYLFDFAVVSGEKEFIKSQQIEKQKKTWQFAGDRVETKTILSEDALTLKARFVQHDVGVKKVAILAHGYMGHGLEMGKYAELFYHQGYDVLVPDNRGHGESEGKYVGFGWLDKEDYKQWIDLILSFYDDDVEIVLFGVSMGAATVMMTSGDELPDQVKVIIEDCGYDSVENELSYQLDEMFGLPAFPLIPLTSVYTKLRVGYSFKEASAVEQLKHNTRPTLFIHGGKDSFVPTQMVYNLYDATKGPKEFVLFEQANHAMSYQTDKKKYEKTVIDFLNTYMPSK